MSDLLFQDQLHQLFGRRRHVLEALTEGNNCKSHPFQVLDHLNGSPAVKGDFLDVELFTQLFDEFLDVSVVNDIAFGGFQEALFLPYIIGNMIPLYSQIQAVFRNPKVRQDLVRFILLDRREDQNKGGDIGGTGKVQCS